MQGDAKKLIAFGLIAAIFKTTQLIVVVCMVFGTL